jgi:hypothetical protein
MLSATNRMVIGAGITTIWGRDPAAAVTAGGGAHSDTW